MYCKDVGTQYGDKIFLLKKWPAFDINCQYHEFSFYVMQRLQHLLNTINHDVLCFPEITLLSVDEACVFPNYVTIKVWISIKSVKYEIKIS